MHAAVKHNLALPFPDALRPIGDVDRIVFAWDTKF